MNETETQNLWLSCDLDRATDLMIDLLTLYIERVGQPTWDQIVTPDHEPESEEKARQIFEFVTIDETRCFLRDYGVLPEHIP